MGHILGIDLTTFGLVIGWLGLIGVMLYTFIITMAFAQLDDVVKTTRELYNLPREDTDWLRSYVIRTLCVSLVINIISGVASILFIYGINFRRSELMIFFMVIMAINIIVSIGMFFYQIFSRSGPGVVCLQIWIIIVELVIFYPIVLLYKEIHFEESAK